MLRYSEKVMEKERKTIPKHYAFQANAIKIILNRAGRSLYLTSRCTFTVMIPEMMSRAICCKKIILNRNASKHTFRLKAFPKFALTLESQRVVINYFRSNRPEVFLGKGFLKPCSKFTAEHPCRKCDFSKVVMQRVAYE